MGPLLSDVRAGVQPWSEQSIRSPDPSGARHCTYKISSLHPDRPLEWTGSWSVPQG